MKKLILSIILLLVSGAGISQNLPQYNKAYFTGYSTFSHLPVRHQIKKAVPQITYKIENIQKGTSKRYVKLFDANGNMTSLKGYDAKDRLISEIKAEYTNGKMQHYSTYIRNRLEKSMTYTWNADRKMTLMEERNRKNKVVNKNTWNYNTDNCLASSIDYKKGTEKIDFAWFYTYHSACNKSKSVLKNGKGEVLKTWTYAQKYASDSVKTKQKKNSTNKWEEVDQIYLIYVNQSFDEKGKVIKNITKLNKSDSSMVEYKRFNFKEELIFHATYLNSRKRPLKVLTFKNNKILNLNIYEYENDLLISHETSYRNKYKRTTKYKYNADDNLISLKVFNKNEQLISYTSITY